MRTLFLFGLIISFTGASFHARAQQYSVSGHVSSEGNPVSAAMVCLQAGNRCVLTDDYGNFKLENIARGKYRIRVTSLGHDSLERNIEVIDKDISIQIDLSLRTTVLGSVEVSAQGKTFGITRLKDIDEAGIYAGKKSEVIVLKDITANTATNNARQIYSRVAGLNIYENDGGAGIQLALGGRGLDPNRMSNFNTRQNGYDISADALGYPESYYTPPAEALERIEIVRGAASLEYGTQFGGIVNFRMKDGDTTKKAQITERLSGGSFKFFNTSTSVGGTIGKLRYYTFYQHKSGNGWRDHSGFNVNTGYASATIKASPVFSITLQYTHMDYLEQQPGGLNDQMFGSDPRQSTKARNWFKVNWNLGAVLMDYSITKDLRFNSRFFGLLAGRSALGVINTVNDPGEGWPRYYRTDDYTNWGNESRFVYTYHRGQKNPFTLLAGVRYYHGHTDRQLGYGNSGSGGAKSDFAFDKSTEYDSLSYSRYTFPNHNVALFAENIFRINSRLSIIPGIRYENIHTNADGFYNNVGADLANNVTSNQQVIEHRKSDRSFLLGGIGLSYNRNSSLQFYANISQNYRAINFNNMSIVNPNIRVNPDLKDETGYSADLGVRGHLSNVFNYDLSVFTINYDNRIGTVWLQDTTSIIYQYTTNISKSRNLGVESFWEVNLWRLIKGNAAKMNLSVFSNLSFIDARYVHSKEPAYENKKVEFVPPVIFKTGITFQKNKITATCQYSYNGKQFGDATNATTPSNNGINGMVPAYYVMDLSADYKISSMFRISGTVNNVTDNRYFTRRADSYPGPGIIPADPRSFYVTLQAKL